MKEEYVTYKQAIKLKKLGFDWDVNKVYHRPSTLAEWELFPWHSEYKDWNNEGKFYRSAPALSLAQKWLREVKKIDVLVFNNACGYGWEISKADPQSRGTMIAFFDNNGEDEPSGMWWTYEKALSAGIDKALDLLTDKKTNGK